MRACLVLVLLKITMGRNVMNDALHKLSELSSEMLQKIIDNSYDEIFVIDKDQTVLYVNPVCSENYGLTQDQIIGVKAYDIINQRYCFPAVAAEVIRKKKSITIEQHTIVGKTLICTATPVLDVDGEIEFIVENSRDVTHLAKMIKQDLEVTENLAKCYKEEIDELRKDMTQQAFMITHSKPMKQIIELAHHVAPTDTSILILGESGTGKGVLTKYIHRKSSRSSGPFITINCAAIPEPLLESELFGYEGGAFTGARKNGKLGLVELANGGTLFFDEIGELPLQLQSKILMMIQEHRFVPVGGGKEKIVDVRIIAATNRNIKKMILNNEFREDLYYRLCVVEIELPPVRDRQEDLLPLIYLFLNKFNEKYNTHHIIDEHALNILMSYDWPGNVREVEHLIERLTVTVRESRILPEHLPSVVSDAVTRKKIEHVGKPVSLEEAVERTTRVLIRETYDALTSSYKVAEHLQISQSKANRLIRRYVTDVT